MKNAIARILLAAGLAAGSVRAAGEEEDLPPGAYAPPTNQSPASVVVSTTQRFIALGMSSEENVSLAVAAEEAAGRVEDVTGLSIPLSRGQPLQLVGRRVEAGGPSRVVKAQGWNDRQLGQKLIIYGPDTADQEDILEGLCWLLLNRHIIHHQDIEARETRLGAAPEWLAAGVAQNLYLALRARNIRVVLSRWQRGEAMSMADILALKYLPEGRWGEKAFSGVAVDWISSLPEAGKVFDRIFTRLAEGQAVTPEWLSLACLGTNSPALLEKHWDLWIAQQSAVRRSWGGLSPEQVAALDRALVIRPEELGFEEEIGTEELAMADLIASRGEPWMPRLALRLDLKLKGLGIGESQEFRHVLDLYGRYLAAVARRPSALASLFGARMSDEELRRLLADADAGFAAFRLLVDERTRYVSGVEAEKGLGPRPVDADAQLMSRFIPRAELQRYVDRFVPPDSR